MKAELEIIYKNEDDCCACGNNVPEGRQVYPTCESKVGDCPCRHCVPPKRKINCHGTCTEYNIWAEAERKKNKPNEKELANLKIRQNIINRAVKRMKRK